MGNKILLSSMRSHSGIYLVYLFVSLYWKYDGKTKKSWKSFTVTLILQCYITQTRNSASYLGRRWKKNHTNKSDFVRKASLFFQSRKFFLHWSVVFRCIICKPNLGHFTYWVNLQSNYNLIFCYNNLFLRIFFWLKWISICPYQ